MKKTKRDLRKKLAFRYKKRLPMSFSKGLSVRRWIAGFVFIFIPHTRLFPLKRVILRLAGIRVGKGVKVVSSVTIIGNGAVSIGDYSFIGHQVLIIAASESEIKIGAYVSVAPRVYIGTGTHKIDLSSARTAGKGFSRSVEIKDGSWIGACAVILPGVVVNQGAVVGAGSLVNKSVEARTLSAGNPVRVVKRLDKDKIGE